MIVRESVAGLRPNLAMLQLEPPTMPTAAGKLQVTPLLQGDDVRDNGVVSSDGRWIAYESTESGQNEIYVRRYFVSQVRTFDISRDGQKFLMIKDGLPSAAPNTQPAVSMTVALSLAGGIEDEGRRPIGHLA